MKNSNTSALIELTKVSKTYMGVGAGVPALRDVDLQFHSGELVAVVGKSGSGKSTLLNMLTGIDHPSTGSVTIQGVAVHALNESALAQWRGRTIGIVFQFFQLIPTLTIEENLLLAMDFVNVIPQGERRARARMLLEQVGIGPHAHKLPQAVSGGEQQRAAIARALANKPPVIIADEPTGNLDSQTAERIQNLFMELADAGHTVIVVTHDNTVGARYDRVITIQDGQVYSDVHHVDALRVVAA